jgi:tagatose-1,6-bisphosphate aldolase non-catalytic subunit AgaZ/GatZ
MIRRKLDRLLNRRRCTLLGVGPMSAHCVDAAIDLANERDIPLFLIASRRQIDAEQFGGGYVNAWTTPGFAQYVIERDKKSRVVLARDHGGPWQNELEVRQQMSLRQAMASAKASYLEDIRAGFQKIHIDPSIDLHGGASSADIVDRVLELYEFCWQHASDRKTEVLFEIGTEEQSGCAAPTEDALEVLLHDVGHACERLRMPKPTFVVVQTGTKVMETRNVGSFESAVRVRNELPVEVQVPRMVRVCESHGVLLKQHNTDYLSTDSLRWHPKLGIHSANVAPEFGVAETRALFEAFRIAKREDLAQRFVSIAVASGKWKKWLLPASNPEPSVLAEICGHYIFARPEAVELKAELASSFPAGHGTLDDFLRAAVRRSIERYLDAFQLGGA